METPSDLRYSKEHEWVRLEGDLATIGITDFAQDQLGDIVYVALPKVGERIEQFAQIGEIESVKSVSDLYTPVGGEVEAVNQATIDTPEVINGSPYGDGWLIRVRGVDAAQLERLLSAEEYLEVTKDEH